MLSTDLKLTIGIYILAILLSLLGFMG